MGFQPTDNAKGVAVKHFRLPEKMYKNAWVREIATPDFRQARNDTTVSDKSLTVVCRFAHPTH
ncbi:MAG: hypothetical protein IKZ88_05295 [Neisseriaceae bacterium]|nr:hypothetical protein [Neisseriaceae bacterium]